MRSTTKNQATESNEELKKDVNGDSVGKMIAAIACKLSYLCN